MVRTVLAVLAGLIVASVVMMWYGGRLAGGR